MKSEDAELKKVNNALARAAKKARKLSIDTKTPYWVEENGKIIDLNKKSGVLKKKSRPSRKTAKRRRA